MIKYCLSLIIILFLCEARANDKEQIILKFEKIENLSFDFEQNVNGKIEEGKCIIKYERRIYCEYLQSNNKILVSNGKSIVIKTNIGSYYRYSLNSTPLNLILDKNFILKQIKSLNEKIIDDKLIKFTLNENELKVDIFFNKNTFNLTGWQTLDIYQNLILTNIYNVKINQKIEDNIFKLPKMN